MHRQRLRDPLLGLIATALLVAPAAAGNDAGRAGRAEEAGAPDPYALAAFIDQQINARLAEANVEPAPLATDGEFLRRVSLDLAGTIPMASEARAYLNDGDPEKHRARIDRLLDSPDYVRQMSRTWRDLLIPEADTDQQVGISALAFDVWLRKRFNENAPYDAMVRELLTAKVEQDNFYGFDFGGAIDPSTFAFVLAKREPGNLAASVSRTFLGVRLECAQCHDHPFSTWTRDEFWGMAAFFAGVENRGNGDFFQGRYVDDRREIRIPDSEHVVQAAYLDGTRPRWRFGDDPRETLADWIVAPENPYFARATANRVWALMMGHGLVDPVDELGPTSDPSHPELLDELARQFVASGYDLRFLFRAIANSEAYRRSSAGYSPGQDEPSLFARMPVRGLAPEQLYDSLVTATGVAREQPDPPFVFGSSSARKDLIDRFAEDGSKPTEHRTTILQALTLMNGRIVADATDLQGTGTLTALSDSYFLTTAEKVEALYLAALCRRPTPEELDRLARYVDRGGPALDPKQGLADVFWAILNSSEFVLNH